MKPTQNTAAGPSDSKPSGTFLQLSRYDNNGYSPGRGILVRAAWYVLSLAMFESGWCPLSRLKVAILRLFGARMGTGVVIKPHVRIKYPWLLEIGDHAWIGQEAWIDNLAPVRIGSNVCVSQRVYLCTGSHDHRKRTFDLITAPITIDDGVWLAAGSIVLGGVRIGANSVVCAGAVIRKDVPVDTITWGSGSRQRETSEHDVHAKVPAIAESIRSTADSPDQAGASQALSGQ